LPWHFRHGLEGVAYWFSIYELPHERVERDELVLNLEELFGIVDCCLNFRSVADNFGFLRMFSASAAENFAMLMGLKSANAFQRLLFA
jgi:hypothetical protein